MAPAGNKVKLLLSVNRTTKTIHHHLHHQRLPFRVRLLAMSSGELSAVIPANV